MNRLVKFFVERMARTAVRKKLKAAIGRPLTKREKAVIASLFGSSWKTSLFGYIGGLLHIPLAIGPDGKINYLMLAQGVIVAILGRLMKDHNVTGGTVAQ